MLWGVCKFRNRAASAMRTGQIGPAIIAMPAVRSVRGKVCIVYGLRLGLSADVSNETQAYSGRSFGERG